MVGHSAKAYCKGIQPELISVASIAKWSKAPVCGTGDHGFESRCSPHLQTPLQLAPVAQRTEYWASDPGVVGSNPAGRTKSRHEKGPSHEGWGLCFSMHWFDFIENFGSVHRMGFILAGVCLPPANQHSCFRKLRYPALGSVPPLGIR